MRELILSYKSSLGLYWEDRKRPLIEGITNLITSIVFGYFWGLNGILIGTMITSIFVNFMLEPVVIFHYGFTRSAYGFYFSNTLRFILVIIIAIITYYINAKINISSYINATLSIGTFKLNLGSFVEIIFNAIVSLVITNGIYILIFRKTESAAIIKKTLMKRK